MEDYIACLSKPRLFVSVSFGESSCYMAKRIRDEYSDKYDIVYGFANTGEEWEQTLVFGNRCDKEWGLGAVWLETVVHYGERIGCTHKVVSFETASRNGEPFEAVIKKYGIPNTPFPHCTRELKLNPMRSYLESIGWAKGTYVSAVGIRADEPKRLRGDAEKAGIVYPLAHWFPMTKPEINDWWYEQPFRLELQPHQGNCKWCWKKSTTKLVRIAQETPEVFEFPARMERDYALVGAGIEESGPRRFFRKRLTVSNIFELSRLSSPQTHNPDPDEDSGCSESCEAFLAPEEA